MSDKDDQKWIHHTDLGGHVIHLVEEAKRLRELAAAESDPVLQRAILLEADKLRREIAISNVKTTAALDAASKGG